MTAKGTLVYDFAAVAGMDLSGHNCILALADNTAVDKCCWLKHMHCCSM